MKILAFSFLTVFIISANAVFAQKSENMDWTDLFPEIPGCERIIEPLTQTGKIFEQTARYQPSRNDNPRIYYGCGSITLRFEPSARKSASVNFSKQPNFPFTRKQTVKTFDAYTDSPLCGNDDWRGSIRVYFDEDKVLIVSAKRGAGDILKFAETADYELMKETIDKFVKAK